MKQINLLKPLPPKKQQSINRWLQLSLAALCTLLVAIAFVQIRQWHQLKNATTILRQLEKSGQSLASNNTQDLQEKKMLQNKLTKVERITHGSDNPSIYLREIAQQLPNNARITSLKREPGKHVQIHGLAKTNSAVTLFLQNMNKSVHFHTSKLNYLKPEDNLVQFVISTHIRKQTDNGKNKTTLST